MCICSACQADNFNRGEEDAEPVYLLGVLRFQREQRNRKFRVCVVASRVSRTFCVSTRLVAPKLSTSLLLPENPRFFLIAVVTRERPLNLIISWQVVSSQECVSELDDSFPMTKSDCTVKSKRISTEHV